MEEMLGKEDALKAAVDRWANVIMGLGGSSEWSVGAIYPREMAYFLANCEIAGIRTIIESGRADGYSTMVLGEFGRITSSKIYSIDLEMNPLVVEKCRERLSRWDIELVKGNAWVEIGRLLAETSGKTALLIDGPKLWTAMAMLYAAAGWPHIDIIAAHNLGQHYSTGRFFRAVAGKATTYEEALKDFHTPAWDALQTQEEQRNSATNALRTGWLSTLNVLRIDENNRDRVSRQTSRRFRTYQPAALRWAWKNNQTGLLRTGANIIERIVGPETDQR